MERYYGEEIVYSPINVKIAYSLSWQIGIQRISFTFILVVYF